MVQVYRKFLTVPSEMDGFEYTDLMTQLILQRIRVDNKKISRTDMQPKLRSWITSETMKEYEVKELANLVPNIKVPIKARIFYNTRQKELLRNPSPVLLLPPLLKDQDSYKRREASGAYTGDPRSDKELDDEYRRLKEEWQELTKEENAENATQEVLVQNIHEVNELRNLAWQR